MECRNLRHILWHHWESTYYQVAASPLLLSAKPSSQPGRCREPHCLHLPIDSNAAGLRGSRWWLLRQSWDLPWMKWMKLPTGHPVREPIDYNHWGDFYIKLNYKIVVTVISHLQKWDAPPNCRPIGLSWFTPVPASKIQLAMVYLSSFSLLTWQFGGIYIIIMVYTPFESICEQTHVVIVNCSVHLSSLNRSKSRRGSLPEASGWVGWIGPQLGEVDIPGDKLTLIWETMGYPRKMIKR